MQIKRVATGYSSKTKHETYNLDISFGWDSVELLVQINVRLVDKERC